MIRTYLSKYGDQINVSQISIPEALLMPIAEFIAHAHDTLHPYTLSHINDWASELIQNITAVSDLSIESAENIVEHTFHDMRNNYQNQRDTVRNHVGRHLISEEIIRVNNEVNASKISHNLDFDRTPKPIFQSVRERLFDRLLRGKAKEKSTQKITLDTIKAKNKNPKRTNFFIPFRLENESEIIKLDANKITSIDDLLEAIIANTQLNLPPLQQRNDGDSWYETHVKLIPKIQFNRDIISDDDQLKSALEQLKKRNLKTLKHSKKHHEFAAVVYTHGRTEESFQQAHWVKVSY